jgi:hypothetical protein
VARYLFLLTAFVVALVTGIVAFTVAVDPYDLVGTQIIDGFNAVKHGIGHHARTTKAYVVRHAAPRTVIFGSSRAESAFNPRHPGLTAQPAYNLAFPAASLYEILRYFQHATAIAPVEEAIVSLDFGMFDANRAAPTWDFDERRLSVDAAGRPQPLYWRDIAALVLSSDAVKVSLWSLRHQQRTLDTYGRDGLRDEQADIPEILSEHGGHRKAFLHNEQGFVCGFAESRATFTFHSEARQLDTIDLLRELLDVAAARHVRLVLLIPPVHARHLELIRQSGMWDAFEEWKRRVALLATDRGVPFWDFAAANSVTTEAVPALGDTASVMRWFRESSHARGNAGTYALNRIFGVGEQIADYGRRLDADDVDGALAVDRRALADWRARFPGDEAEIADLLRRCAPGMARFDSP